MGGTKLHTQQYYLVFGGEGGGVQQFQHINFQLVEFLPLVAIIVSW